MSSLRPSSVCDTTPLQRLESQSSSSEPSSPTSSTLNGVCIGSGVVDAGAGGDILIKKTANKTLFLTKHNNNKINDRNPRNCEANHHHHHHPMKMDMQGTRKICFRILLDALILICVVLPITYFCFWGEPYKRGFFCDDASLKHPYRTSTLKSWMLYLTGIALPVSLIVAIEFFKSNEKKMRGIDNLSDSRYYFWHLEIPDWIVECYQKIGLLIFGIGIGQLTADIAKYSIGRYRPHFFAVCQPIMSDGTTCDDANNAGVYIENFACLANDVTPRMLKQVALSFPSGHAVFSSFTMIYIAIYLQTNMIWPRSKMFKHLLQFLFLMFAWYTALTRVSDYKHHWTDVLAGSAIGTFNALVLSHSMW